MSLESFGEQLRKARERKQISLVNISEATRISVKFLEAMEAGKFSILPQAYIRAFIREYARAIDLDQEELVRQYDAANEEIQSVAEEWIARSRSKTMLPNQERAKDQAPWSMLSQKAMMAFALLVVAAIAVVYFTNTGSNASHQGPASEVAFDKVVRESEAATVKPGATETVSSLAPASDSLKLEITTLDSVWMAITIDNSRKGEYLFPPQRKRTWMGKEQFEVSIGNAGGATFRLNDVELGELGKRGAVLRNIVITRSGIRKPE
jgi:cytoskeleton protein RodZ